MYISMQFTESFHHIYYVILKIHFYRAVLYTFCVFDIMCVCMNMHIILDLGSVLCLVRKQIVLETK